MMVQITLNTYGNGGDLIWAVMKSGCALVEVFGSVATNSKIYFLIKYE